jgi:hypothetical protein
MTLERHSFHRILRGSAETLSVTWSVDGVAVDPGTVTVTISNAAGTALVTDGATGGTGASDRTYALTPTHTADLDLLTAVWSGTVNGQATSVTTYAEIVGAHLFTIAQARNFDKQQLSSAAGFNAAVIEEARARITDAFERVCGVSFIPRYKRVTLHGTDAQTLILPDLFVTRIRSFETRTSGTVTWTAFTSTELADLFVTDYGELFRESLGIIGTGYRNVRVGYEYGFAQPPLEISRAALKVLVSQAVSTNLPERATQQVDEFGTFRLVMAGDPKHPFGIPEVDAVLTDPAYSYRIPGIA